MQKEQIQTTIDYLKKSGKLNKLDQNIQSILLEALDSFKKPKGSLSQSIEINKILGKNKNEAYGFLGVNIDLSKRLFDDIQLLDEFFRNIKNSSENRVLDECWDFIESFSNKYRELFSGIYNQMNTMLELYQNNSKIFEEGSVIKNSCQEYIEKIYILVNNMKNYMGNDIYNSMRYGESGARFLVNETRPLNNILLEFLDTFDKLNNKLSEFSLLSRNSFYH